MLRKCRVFNLVSSGLQDYSQVWSFQKALMDKCWQEQNMNNECEDSLLVVQHQSVYTLGKGGKMENIKFCPTEKNSPIVYRVERGGEVTWHGAGQLVCYPIFNLNFHKRDLHWFLRSLEDSVISTLRKYDVESGRSPINTGVWIGNKKISAIGVTASRWITMHGVAINLNCDLKGFEHIVPCGISSDIGGVCRLRDFSNEDINIEKFTQEILCSFSQQFNLEMLDQPNPLEHLKDITNNSSFKDSKLTRLTE